MNQEDDSKNDVKKGQLRVWTQTIAEELPSAYFAVADIVHEESLGGYTTSSAFIISSNQIAQVPLKVIEDYTSPVLDAAESAQ